MSSTITETERRSVPKISTPVELLKKRDQFTRSGSIEKLKKFNNYICSQHYYILPSLLLWLKTSQSILTSNMEKCMMYVKSMFLISIVYQGLEAKDNSYAAFFKLSAKDVLPLLNLLLIKTNEVVTTAYEEIKRLILVSSIYLGVCLIFCQMLGLICLIFFKFPPLGFVFLVGCVLFMSRIAVIVMFKRNTQNTQENDKPEEQKINRKKLTYIGKTISNVKLF